MKPTKPRLLLIVLGVMVIGAIFQALLPKPVDVDVAPVTRGPLQVSVNEDGKTRIKDRYIVSAPLSGRVLRVELHPGDPVEAGATLLTSIEPTDPALLDPRARAESEARVKASDAARQRATSMLERARAAEELARTELARAKQLVSSGAMSHQEFDNAELKERSAAEEHKAAQFALQISEFELDQAKAVLLQAQPRAESGATGARFEVRSPVNGRVLRVFQESATIVTSGARLIEIGDPANLEIEVDVLSTDAVKIQPGAKILLEHWGGDAPLHARVRLVEPSAFMKVSALGVEEQRVNVIADLVDPPEKWRSLGDGFRVEARIIVSEGENILQIPVGALFRRGGDWAVFTTRPGRAMLRTVKIGRRNDQQAEVVDGVTEKETVIVHPGDKVRDGVAIKPRSNEL